MSSNGLLLERQSRQTRTTLGDRSFQVATPKLWNTLPHVIHSFSDVNTSSTILRHTCLATRFLFLKGYLLFFLITYNIFNFILYIINLMICKALLIIFTWKISYMNFKIIIKLLYDMPPKRTEILVR